MAVRSLIVVLAAALAGCLSDPQPLAVSPDDGPAGDAPTVTYDFESGLQGFWCHHGCTVSSSTEHTYGGTGHALAVTLSVVGAGDAIVLSTVSPLPQPGDVVTFHVWVPADANITTLQPHVQADNDPLWPWVAEAYLVPDRHDDWLTVTLPPVDTTLPIYCVGLKVNTRGSSTATLFLDEIGW
jgi:hypothetical protein